MNKLGFSYNMNTCAACGSCQVACKESHGLKPEEFFRRVSLLMEGPYSGSCNHCEDSACVKACPTGAMYRSADGTIQHDDGRCIGCGSCMWNCPYGAISFSKTKGVTQKCDSCVQRRTLGLEPLCVAACPTGSLKFGPVENVSADMSFLPDPSVTHPVLNITPSSRYLRINSNDGGITEEADNE